MIDWLGFVWVVVVELHSVLRCGPQIAWFQCEHRNWLGFCRVGRYWLDFRVGDRAWYYFILRIGINLFWAWGRKWLGFSIWIEIDLNFVWWYSTANRHGVLTDICVCYFLENHSVTVDWVAQWFILHKRTKKGRASKSSQGWLSSTVA